MPTVLLLLSPERGFNSVMCVPAESGVYVACVMRQYLDKTLSSARLMELFDVDCDESKRFEGAWSTLGTLRRAALAQKRDVVVVLKNTVYLYKHAR